MPLDVVDHGCCKLLEDRQEGHAGHFFVDARFVGVGVVHECDQRSPDTLGKKPFCTRSSIIPLDRQRPRHHFVL